MGKPFKDIRHDYIRYANCWEDADILLEGLQVNSGDKVLSIGSAGDNSFSLLINDPELIVSFDINSVQLNLIKLKKAAIKALDYDSFLEFLGFYQSNRRRELYVKVKEHLSPETHTFWDKRIDEIESGIIYQGKFERYFKLFRTRVLPLVHSNKIIDLLFLEKDEDEQKEFYRKKWNNIRWNALFKMFFSKFVMGRFGRDPQFLKEVKIPVSTFILTQAEKHLSSVYCQRNYFLEFIFKGSFQSQLPHYARKENFEIIKSRIDRLTEFNGVVEDVFNQYSNFNKFNLSNIFEYMNPKLFKQVSHQLVDGGTNGARYAYWNLMVPRKMSEITNLVFDTETSRLLTKKDKCFFYGNVNFDIKNE